MFTMDTINQINDYFYTPSDLFNPLASHVLLINQSKNETWH